jgi:hypothetical protein
VVSAVVVDVAGAGVGEDCETTDVADEVLVAAR